MIEQMAQAAQVRVARHINRSAGQHQRAIAKSFQQLREQTK